MTFQEEKPLTLNFSTPKLTLPKSVAIVGCGDLGQRIGHALASEGVKVYGIKRRAGMSETIHWISQDVRVPFDAPLPAVEHLIFCIAPDRYNLEDYRSVYVEGLKNSLAALSAPLQHLWVVSSTGVYGDTAGWIDENTPVKPANAFNEALCDMERIAAAGHPTTVLRLAGIYGPGRLSILEKVQAGLGPCAVNALWSNRIHRDDAARMLIFLMAQHQANNSIDELYLGVDQEPCLMSDVVEWMREQLEVTAVDSSIEIKRQSQKRISSARICDLGFEFLYPSYKEGYSELVKSIAKAL